MTDDIDDLFVSLGGSLMRDLLADLQAESDGDVWSLEQLEKELTHFELHQPAFTASSSAAATVVSHAQERAAATVGPATQPSYQVPAAGDAWSQSLERFTAMSLEKDFLAADSSRKRSAQKQRTALPDFAHAEEYNTSEMITIAPPPGLSSASNISTTPPPPGMNNLKDECRISVKDVTPNATSGDSNESNVEDQVAALRALLHIPQPKVPPPKGVIPRPPPPTPQNSVCSVKVIDNGEAIPPLSMSFVPQSPPPFTVIQGHSTFPGPTIGTPPTLPVMAPVPPAPVGDVVPVTAIPIATHPIRPAWQVPPKPFPLSVMPTQQPIRRMYCMSHPSASPIPAAALESKLMNARDIAYVVHAILKPLLVQGSSESDYDIQYLRRRGDASNAVTPVKTKDLQAEAQSRSEKSKEWSNQHNILGHVAKSNITRPRALIATPTIHEHPDNFEQRERANLWKARIYCDQGYQAYLALSEAWLSSLNGSSGPAIVPIQTHLKKLLKCFGTTPPTNPESGYMVTEPTALELLVKLSKGKVLVARVIEQALLPAAAVQALLPYLFKTLLRSSNISSSQQLQNIDVSDDRVFSSLIMVIQTLPHMAPAALIASLQEVLNSDSQAALGTMARMECVHALLLRGSTLASQVPPVDHTFVDDWVRLEGQLMAILGG